MKNTKLQNQGSLKPTGKQLSYNEVVEFLDAHWNTNTDDKQLSQITQLDKAFGSISQQLDTIVVTGTNGKSLTSHFTTRLLQEEGIKIGTFYAPHILTYNERFSINNESVSNKNFTEAANEVINTAQTLDLTLNTFELLTIIALIYFKNNKVDVVILETNTGDATDATMICNPKIAAITRVIDPTQELKLRKTKKPLLESALSCVKPGTIAISADQSKLSLQIMQEITTKKGGQWAMPIRKVAALSYPFEQLHGRCAALAERIATVYINSITNTESVIVTDSLLAKTKGQRGRPTLEAKRRSELNPKRTIEQFWRDTTASLPARFQLIDKEKPSILLDAANNIDALDNLFLGVRLLHYQRPLKGITIILGCNNDSIDRTELLRMIRYFFKKTSGQIVVCPVKPAPGHKGNAAWDTESLTNDIKAMKVKATAAKDFAHAFQIAKQTVDERDGLVIVTGSQSIVSEYWKHRGIKKIS